MFITLVSLSSFYYSIMKKQQKQNHFSFITLDIGLRATILWITETRLTRVMRHG